MMKYLNYNFIIQNLFIFSKQQSKTQINSAHYRTKQRKTRHCNI